MKNKGPETWSVEGPWVRVLYMISEIEDLKSLSVSEDSLQINHKTNYSSIRDFYLGFLDQYQSILLKSIKRLGSLHGYNELPVYLRENNVEALNGLLAIDISVALNPLYNHKKSDERIDKTLESLEKELRLLGSGKRIRVVDIEQFGPINAPREDILSVFRIINLTNIDLNIRIISDKFLEEKELQFFDQLSKICDLTIQIKNDLGAQGPPNHLEERDYIRIKHKIPYQIKEKISFWSNKEKIIGSTNLPNRYLSLLRELGSDKTYNQLSDDLNLSRSTLVSYCNELYSQGLLEKKEIKDPRSGSKKILLSLSELGEKISLLLWNLEDLGLIKEFLTFDLTSQIHKLIEKYLFNGLPPPTTLFYPLNSLNALFFGSLFICLG